MPSNKFLLNVFALISSIYFIGCTVQPDASDDYNIGNSVQTVSAINAADGEESKNIVIFDETVRRIHQFNVTNMTFIRSLEVTDPQEKHYVLYNDTGNYIVDLTTKGLTIYNRYGQANKNPISFQGKPRSAAFRQDLNLLVVYDDLMSVGILKLDQNGDVLKTWVGGAKILNNGSISSGDISADGKLILSLSTDNIAVVDIEQTLAQKKWVLEAGSPFASTLSEIKWLAPVQGKPEQIFVRSLDKLALLDINTHTVLNSLDLDGYYVQKLSKSIDPHLILRAQGTGSNSLLLAYVENSQIKTNTLYRPADSVLTSTLDLQNDIWSFVDTKAEVGSIFYDINDVREGRLHKSYRVSDMLALSSMKVPNKVQVQLAQKFVFALFPSELGLATRTNVGTGEVKELPLFNVGYIPKN